ncbi:unnamed protein product [Rhizophagus irregularis]|nr:unnamed protein product [Rhizophagus irregularis]CAB5394399.1 unnamed protein product [Rhizophagus irregularis]
MCLFIFTSNEILNAESILDFLNKSTEKPFRLKIDTYLKSLELIMKSEYEKRCDKAKLLYDDYKKASKNLLLKVFKYVVCKALISPGLIWQSGPKIRIGPVWVDASIWTKIFDLVQSNPGL